MHSTRPKPPTLPVPDTVPLAVLSLMVPPSLNPTKPPVLALPDTVPLAVLLLMVSLPIWFNRRKNG